MDTQNTSRQLRYLEEVRIPLHRAGFGTLPLEGEQLPVLWNSAPLCRITGKGSVCLPFRITEQNKKTGGSNT